MSDSVFVARQGGERLEEARGVAGWVEGGMQAAAELSKKKNHLLIDFKW